MVSNKYHCPVVVIVRFVQAYPTLGSDASAQTIKVSDTTKVYGNKHQDVFVVAKLSDAWTGLGTNTTQCETLCNCPDVLHNAIFKVVNSLQLQAFLWSMPDDGSIFLFLARVTPPFRYEFHRHNVRRLVDRKKLHVYFLRQAVPLNWIHLCFWEMHRNSCLSEVLWTGSCLLIKSADTILKVPVVYHRRVTSCWKTGARDRFRFGWGSMWSCLLLKDLDLSSLENRRKMNKLTLLGLYKIRNNLLCIKENGYLERADSRTRDASRNYNLKSAKSELYKH